LGAGLFSIGVPKDSIVQYESDLKAGKYLVVVHGSPEIAQQAKNVIEKTNNLNVEHHEASA